MLNRFLSRGATLLLLCGAIVLAQPKPASNLISNGEFESDPAGWVFVSRGGAVGSMQIVADKPLNPQQPKSARIEAKELGEVCGIATPPNVSIKSGSWYDISFVGRMENAGSSVGLLFSLETEDGKKICARTTLPEIGRVGKIIEGNADNWRQYTVSLHAYGTDAKCRLVISPIEPATVYIDSISMNQRP